MKSNKALEWIVDFLETKNIPYLICGGLAAIAYGSTRQLHDIDLYVSSERYLEVVAFGEEFNSDGPKRLHDANWNVEYVQFFYEDQKVEVGSSDNVGVYDAIGRTWFQKHLDFTNYMDAVVYGRKVRVMDKASLIEYKKKLNREVDIIDIEEMLKI